MTAIYIISKNGHPLMPTTRCGHVRYLLKHKKARVVERCPFTIQLLYETTEITQPLYIGIDPGRTNIGISVVKENGEAVLSAQLATRNKEIPKLMASRKAYRMAHRKFKRRDKRRRRARTSGTTFSAPNQIIERVLPGCTNPIICHDIRNKEARFNNRKRPTGWLTPTANHLLQTHLNLICKIEKFLPITDVVIELDKFTFMELDNPNIRKWEYQRGPLYKTSGVEDAVFVMQEGHCIFCKNSIKHYHHVVPRHLGGSETLDNRAGLCEHHHHLVHTDDKWKQKLATKKAGLNKKYGALSVLNQIIPYLIKELTVRFPNHCYSIDSKSTFEYRENHDIPKDHHLDAYCIACNVLDVKNPNYQNIHCYQLMQFRRHDRQCCHQQMLDRKYRLDGNIVATNRRKAMEQFTDSLEEYRNKLIEEYGEQEARVIISKLSVKEHKPIYKDTNRIMPGSILIYNSKPFILHHSQGRENGKPSYYFDTCGNKYRANKCKQIINNTGILFLNK